MAGSKTDTAIRYPEAEDQKRRLRHVTQDRKWEARMRDQANSAANKKTEATTWGPEDYLRMDMDESGNPLPDPSAYADGNKARRYSQLSGIDEQDLWSAANDQFD
ncbi:hypothetical protein VTN49DRAFT_1141 [Thermomyces lanuginosus]|uniref:uncharacterized protein n=1 Tax=Thermomyces lanuginosus TaxID=5541 RepID=UPI00374305D9